MYGSNVDFPLRMRDMPPQFLKAGFVRDVIDILGLDADENGKRNGRFGFHARSSSTDMPEAWKSLLRSDPTFGGMLAHRASAI